VLDFGVSKNLGTAAANANLTNGWLGTLTYMSPEQMCSARDVDGRTDIWALGAILFKLLTARAPFSGGSQLEVAARVATAPPRSLCALRPEVPRAIETVVARCLEKDRDRRCTLGELVAVLGAMAPARARPIVARMEYASGRQDPPPKKSKSSTSLLVRALAAMGLLVALVLIASLVGSAALARFQRSVTAQATR
jgi:serine/threonine-protein kinase